MTVAYVIIEVLTSNIFHQITAFVVIREKLLALLENTVYSISQINFLNLLHFYICTQLCVFYEWNKSALMHDIISCMILGGQFKWTSKQIVNWEERDLQFFNKIPCIRGYHANCLITNTFLWFLQSHSSYKNSSGM